MMRDIIGHDYVEYITSGSDTITGKVDTYAELGLASVHPGEWWLVNQSTGVWFINRRERGFYYSDGSNWNYAPDLDQDLKTTSNPRFSSVVVVDSITGEKGRIIFSNDTFFIQKEVTPGVWKTLAKWGNQ